MAEAAILKAVQGALEASKQRERKFTQTVDLAINLKGVDLSIPKNRIEEEVPLPHGRGKSVKIALFASGELAVRGRTAVDYVFTADQIGELANDKKRFKKLATEVTFFVAEAPLMPVIGKSLGVVLGPRGKMPRPVPPNVDIATMATNIRKTVRLRSKDRATFHATVGSEDMSAEQLADNIELVLKRIETKLEQGRNNIRSAFVKTTMGPSQKVI